MTLIVQEKISRWNRELKPTFLERSSNVRLCRNVSYAISLVAAAGAYVSGSRLRGTPVFTLTVLGITASTSVVAVLFGRHFGRQTTFEKDPQWKLEQYQIAEKAIFNGKTSVMKIGVTKARSEYGKAIEEADVRRWLEADISNSQEFIYLPQFHGTDFTNRDLFTETSRHTLVDRFTRIVQQGNCTKTANELSTAWDNILTAHGVEESVRKTLFSYPSFRKALSESDYSILHQSGNLNDIWGSLTDTQKTELKAVFIAYANRCFLSMTTLLQDYADALEKFELIIPLPQQNRYDLAVPVRHRPTDRADRVWSADGEDLLRSAFNGAVNASENYEDLRNNHLVRGGFQNIDLLQFAAGQRLRELFLNLSYSKMCNYAADMPLLNISEEERNGRLNDDFSQLPVGAWKKHGLQPIHDGIISADNISTARSILVEALRLSSLAVIESHRPLIKALQAETEIAEMQQSKWLDVSIFSLGRDEARAFIEYYKSLAQGHAHRGFWLSKILQDAESISYSVLRYNHIAFFDAGVLHPVQFAVKFHDEIDGKSFEAIVKDYGLEWLDAQLGLVTRNNPAIRRLVGHFLLTSMQLPVNLTQPSANLTALETYGFFSEELKRQITSASTDIHKANERLRQETQQFKDAFNQTMKLVEQQCSACIRIAKVKYVEMQSRVQKTEEVERLTQLMKNGITSQAELEKGEKKALEEVEAVISRQPQGEANICKRTLRDHNNGIAAQEKQKQLEAELKALLEKLPATQSAANKSREDAATHTTAFGALALAVDGRTTEEKSLMELNAQISTKEKALADATEQAKSTQSDIRSEKEVKTIKDQLQIFDDYQRELSEKSRLHTDAQNALAKCIKDIQSHRKSLDDLKAQLGNDSPDTQVLKLNAQIAKAEYDEVVTQADLTKEREQKQARETQERATQQANVQYEGIRARKQAEVSEAIQRIYGLA